MTVRQDGVWELMRSVIDAAQVVSLVTDEGRERPVRIGGVVDKTVQWIDRETPITTAALYSWTAQ